MSTTLEVLNAALAGRYVVEREIGAGGMAVVYRAVDEKHHRPVAFKVLRPELAATIGKGRFLREIDVAARLQHPMIVPVYDSGEAGGLLYYVMPFVEGTSLRQRLAGGRPLSPDETVRIVRDVASALEYAHLHGVIHRDIKPENILLTAGRAVVTDFGIARALRAAGGADSTPAGGTALTGVGLAIGTPAYMSPEQALGGDDVDARSDIYALACVVFEMLSGQQPFTGPTMQVVMTQSVAGPRPRLHRVRPDLPPGIDRVLLRALSVDAADRPDSAVAFADQLERAVLSIPSPVPSPPAVPDDVVAAARAAIAPKRRAWLAAGVAGLVVVGSGAALWWRTHAAAQTVAPGAQTIAVMPFQIALPGMEVMREGMVDLLSRNLNDLGGIRTIDPPMIIARSQRQRGEDVPDLASATELARDLGAGSVLTGSIVSAGGSVRLSAALHGVDGQALANAQVNGPADSVLALVDSLTLKLLRNVWLSKEPLPSVRVSAITTGSLSALREYLRGEQFYRRSQWDSADVAYGRAIEADSTFALAVFRRTLARGWTGASYGSPEMRQHAAVVAQFSGKLSSRERALFNGYRLFDEGKAEAIDSARVYTQQYPQDTDGWYLLGEAQYHTRHINALDPTALRAPFDRVLELDSTLAPAAIHPVEIAMQTRDSTGFNRYVRLLRGAGADVQAAPLPGLAPALWGRATELQADSALYRSFAVNNGYGSLLAGILRLPGLSTDQVIRRMANVERMVRPEDDRKLRWNLAMERALLLSTTGRLDASGRVADSIMVFEPMLGARLALYPRVLGLAGAGPHDRAARGIIEKSHAPIALHMLINEALGQRDLPRARMLLDQALQSDSVRASDEWRALFTASRGWMLVLQGDSTTGLRLIDGGVRAAGGPMAKATAPVRYFAALIMTLRPDTRAEGIRRLRYGFDGDPEYLPLTYEALGRALEAEGDRPAAAEAYGQFVRLWSGADESLQPRVRQVKRVLADLMGEPRPAGMAEPSS